MGEAPLVGLEGAHRAADRELDLLDAERLDEESVLGADIVLDADLRKPGAIVRGRRVRRRRGVAVAEHVRHHDEILRRVERLAVADQVLDVEMRTDEPGREDDDVVLARAERAVGGVGDPGPGQRDAAIEGEIAEFEVMDFRGFAHSADMPPSFMKFAAATKLDFVRGEEDEHRRHLFRLGAAAERRELHQHLRILLGDRARHRRVDIAGQHAVDADVVRGVGDGGVLRQHHRRGLGGLVGDVVLDAGPAPHRGDVDDRAAAHLHHARQHGLHAEELADDVDVEIGAHHLDRFLVHRLVGRADAGIVDEHVGRAEGVRAGIERRGPFALAADIELCEAERIGMRLERRRRARRRDP